jgi:hypothetical protein
MARSLGLYRAVGGIAGGLLGHQVGGHGQTGATVAGTLLGPHVGSEGATLLAGTTWPIRSRLESEEAADHRAEIQHRATLCVEHAASSQAAAATAVKDAEIGAAFKRLEMRLQDHLQGGGPRSPASADLRSHDVRQRWLADRYAGLSNVN